MSYSSDIMALVDRQQDPESGLNPSPVKHSLAVLDEKPSLSIATSQRGAEGQSTARGSFKEAWSGKMARIGQLLLPVLLLVLLAVAYASATPLHRLLGVTKEDKHFQEMLAAVPDSTLHDVLNEFVIKNYQNVAYPGDRPAIEAVHKANPAAALSLVELARRQAGNQTVNTTPATTSDTPVTESRTVFVTSTIEATASPSPSSTPLPTSTPATSTTEENSVSTPATSPITSSGQLSSSTSSPVIASTTSSTSSSTTTQILGSSATSSSASSTISSSPTSTSTTAASSTSPTITTSSVAVTSRRSTTRSITYVTTEPNGVLATVTSYVVVAAGDATSTESTVTSPTLVPGLQTNVAVQQTSGKTNSMLAGLIVAALAMF